MMKVQDVDQALLDTVCSRLQQQLRGGEAERAEADREPDGGGGKSAHG